MLSQHFNQSDLVKTHFFEQIITLEHEIFNHHLKAFYQLDNQMQFIILHQHQQLIGYVSYKKLDDSYDIYKLAIKQQYQHQKYGTHLLSHLFNNNIVLEVNQINDGAIGFYQHHQFKIINNIPNYYRRNDGYKMYRSKINGYSPKSLR